MIFHDFPIIVAWKNILFLQGQTTQTLLEAPTEKRAGAAVFFGVLLLPSHSLILKWACLKMGYTPNDSHLVGVMISKTIGFRGLAYFQTNPNGTMWGPKIAKSIVIGVMFTNLAAKLVNITPISLWFWYANNYSFHGVCKINLRLGGPTL